VQGLVWTECSVTLLSVVHDNGSSWLLESDYLRSAAIESPALLGSTEAILIGASCIKMSSSAMQGHTPQEPAATADQVDDLERLCSLNWINVPVG
jgi:hypothetical protein